MSKSDLLAKLDGVWRAFDGRSILRGFDLELQPGEVHALVGRNGAGKSTAIAILLGLRAPHGGRSEVFGSDSGELTGRQLDELAYVSGGAQLYSSAKLSELIAFEQRTRKRFDRDLCRRILDSLGLQVKGRFGKLSTGQRQQVALALAVAARPRLLVLDEPALGLDVAVRRDFLTALAELVAGGDSGALLSTHLLGEAERIADRCTVLHQGVAKLRGELFRDLEREVRLVAVRGDASGPGASPDALPGVIASRQVGDGWELLTRNADQGSTALWSSAGFTPFGEPVRPTLEDLFLCLTGESHGSAFRMTPSTPEVPVTPEALV